MVILSYWITSSTVLDLNSLKNCNTNFITYAHEIVVIYKVNWKFQYSQEYICIQTTCVFDTWNFIKADHTSHHNNIPLIFILWFLLKCLYKIYIMRQYQIHKTKNHYDIYILLLQFVSWVDHIQAYVPTGKYWNGVGGEHILFYYTCIYIRKVLSTPVKMCVSSINTKHFTNFIIVNC